MFTSEEKVLLIDSMNKLLSIESANLRSLKAMRFQDYSRINKLSLKVSTLRLILSKLESGK